MAANKTIGGINVTITATIEKFAKNITAARRMIGTFTKSVSGLVFSLKGLAAAFATAFVIRGASRLLTGNFEAINALKDLSDKTGVSTEKLAGLQLAAEEAGVSVQTLEKALVKLNKEYGLRADIALDLWITKTSKLTTASERLSAATAMFGSRGSDMARLVGGGVAALEEAQRAAEISGKAIDYATATGVDRATENFERLRSNIAGIFQQISAQSWPVLDAMSTAANSFIERSGGAKTIGGSIAASIGYMAAEVVDLIQKMVAGVLRAVADVREAYNNFRGSHLAASIGGFTVPTVAELNSVGEMKSTAAWLEHPRNKPSEMLRRILERNKAENEIEARAARISAEGSPFVDAIKDFAKTQLGGYTGMANGLANVRPTMMQSLWWKSIMGAGGMDFSRGSGPGRTPGLSFAESGSVESYRQQAAIRKQGDDIAKKQLGVQQQIRDGINNLADVINFPAANLKG